MTMLERLEKIGARHRVPSCRCCGGVLGIFDGITQAVREGVGIHTRCIVKHWDAHAKSKRAKRCKEFEPIEGSGTAWIIEGLNCKI